MVGGVGSHVYDENAFCQKDERSNMPSNIKRTIDHSAIPVCNILGVNIAAVGMNQV